MGGYSTYARNKRYRLYRITKFRTSLIRDEILTRRVKADPLDVAEGKRGRSFFGVGDGFGHGQLPA